MGRRAKNKQGDPAPLDESVFLNRAGKSKRKAEDDNTTRLSKKTRRVEATQRIQTKPSAKGKSKENRPTKSNKKVPEAEGEYDDEWNGLGEDGDEDLDAQRQYVQSSQLSFQ